MSESRTFRPKARLPRGFRDRGPREIAAERAVLDTIRRTYESWGFEPLETPAFEYTEALGKFLPDLDRPNEGVFSLQDEDGQWMSLRYDLTAPLARYVAENFQNLPKPFRRYQTGSVWRNEKPGPGRFREFTQFDADTVGSNAPAADAELLMMLADTLDALGLSGQYVIKINSRKLLDGLLEAVDVEKQPGESVKQTLKRVIVLRAIDKLDRLGIDGVRSLLTSGRKDDSGDFTPGANLSDQQVQRVLDFTQIAGSTENTLDSISSAVGDNDLGRSGLEEMRSILGIVTRSGYGPDRIRIDTAIVRGLDYYTGPVFEAQLTFPVTNEDGETVVFGSVAGGGRYDDLVARFTGQQVPATGISIGVSRLISALKDRAASVEPLVVVLAVDKEKVGDSFAMARELRAAGIRAETYTGNKKFGDQLKYADRRGAAIAVIEGGDERAKGEVQLKDLALGSELAKTVESRADWVEGRAAQISVKRGDLVAQVRKMLARS